MPKEFRKLIIIQKKRCHMRRKKSGVNTFTYEIRYRREGYSISASGVTVELAKENFIKKLNNARPKNSVENLVPRTFAAFAVYFFEKKRRRVVAEETYKKDLVRTNNYLIPYFKETPLNKITWAMCQELIDSVVEKNFLKTASELLSLMNLIFRFAIDNHLIDRSPSSAVILERYTPKSGSALTADEQKHLLACAKGTKWELSIALALYCGLRPNELKTAEIHGEFIRAVNSKRHGKRKNDEVEYKYIPIIDRLRPFLPAEGPFEISAVPYLEERMRHFLPNHKLYDLRTTFFTHCQMYNVAEAAMKEFMGHSFGRLGNAYSDLTTYGKYLISEGKKLNAWE